MPEIYSIYNAPAWNWVSLPKNKNIPTLSHQRHVLRTLDYSYLHVSNLWSMDSVYLHHFWLIVSLAYRKM